MNAKRNLGASLLCAYSDDGGPPFRLKPVQYSG